MSFLFYFLLFVFSQIIPNVARESHKIMSLRLPPSLVITEHRVILVRRSPTFFFFLRGLYYLETKMWVLMGSFSLASPDSSLTLYFQSFTCNDIYLLGGQSLLRKNFWSQKSSSRVAE